MNRRALFRAALAGAVVGLTRHLPMPKAPAVAATPLTMNEVMGRIEEEELCRRMKEALDRIPEHSDGRMVIYVNPELLARIRKEYTPR